MQEPESEGNASGELTATARLGPRTQHRPEVTLEACRRVRTATAPRQL